MALPSGYKPLEYITCAGKQWFDTGLSASANLKVEVCVKPASNGLGENAILGASWSASGFFLMFYNNQVKFHSKGASVQTTGFDTTAKSIIQCTQTSLVVNGTSYNLSGGGSDVSTTISLFNVTDAGIGSNNAAMHGDCYYCKMWQGTTLVRDYQPCLNSSGVPGMYDLVSGVFYPSTSGTAFTSGPVANDGRLEYIESSGTQYVNTNFKPSSQNVKIKINFLFTAQHSRTSLFGVQGGTSSQMFVAYGNPAFYIGTSGDLLPQTTSLNVRYTLEVSANGGSLSVALNGVQQTASYSGNLGNAYSLYLFANNVMGTTKEQTSARLYSCQIYDNGVLTRDYIPYRYNNEVGLWDRVSNTFYGNSGTGAFLAGPDAAYEKLEYIEGTGTQYIDTGVSGELPLSVSLKMRSGSGMSSTDTVMCGMYQGSAGCMPVYMYQGKWVVSVGSVTDISPTGYLSDNTEYVVEANMTTDTYELNVNGTRILGGSISGGGNTNTLYLFARHDGNGVATRIAKGRIYYCRIYRGATLVRDFVPVVRSDGTVGLYDQLNEIFHENAGTGIFVAGPIAKYARVEYLESTGTQYVDTEFYPKYNSRVVVDLSGLGTQKVFVFGARDTASSTAANQFDVIRESPTNIRTDYFGTNKSLAISDATGRTVIDKNANVTTMFGSTITNTPVSSGQCANSLFLFTANNVGNAFSPFASYRLYSCQIYDNGTLVRDFVPAVRADGTPGLLDQVNNAFYTNSGTGTFVVGPDLDYTKLEYIESTGTQYVDTGFIPNQDTRVVIDCQAYSTYSGGSFPFGTRMGLADRAFTVALTDSQAFYNYASKYQFADYPNTLERMLIDANKNVASFAGSTAVTINLASGTFTGGSTLLVATFNNAGTPDVGDPAWVGAIWSCQIYDNGVLIRDYVPALRENGQIGLIDLVSGLFYANAGSGVFIAGPEIADPDPPEPPGPYEPPSFTEQTLAYLAALRYPFYKLCRLRFLQPDGSTAFSLDNNPKNRRSGAFIADGSISANLQNGKRRTATVTLSNLDSSFDYNVNTVWFGTEIAIDEGLILHNGSEYYIQQGVFAIENPTEAVEPANRTATYNLVDKWSYLDGTLFGNLESTYEVPVGTNIFQPIEAILALDRGNGQPVDGVTPIFTEYYNSKTQALPDGSTANLVDSPYTLRIDSDNGTYADVLLGLAAMVNAWIGYDQTGALRMDPSQDDILDTNKPILWQFSMDEATFLGANYTVRNVDVYNDYIVLGELLDDNSQPAGRATNLDPRSDTNVQTIGRKTFRMSAPGFATDKQCQDLAVWKLKRSTSLQKAISISCSQLFHIEENGLVTIVRTDKPGSPVERHLVMGFTRPLTSNGEMQINAVSVQDFVTATVTSWPE